MKQVEPNLWKTTLELMQQTYEYKFVTYTDTVGQSGVTGYFTDPLNPRAGGPFNNSFITVKDPMIFYLLPKSGSSITNDRPEITADISVANSSKLDLTRIVFRFDGVTIPNAHTYYDTTKKLFSYTPPQGLTYTSHTAYLKVFNTKGDSLEATTTFTVASFFSKGPYEFMFDSKSPNFNFQSAVNRVDVKGKFNSDGLSSMTDPDSDGVYTFTSSLNVNEPNEYTVIINSGSYINDPDNPNLSTNHRTYIIKKLNGLPRFTGFTPQSGITYQHPVSNVTIKTIIVRNDSAASINTSSLAAEWNGNSILITTDSAANGNEVTAVINSPPAGRHVVKFSGADARGNIAAPVEYVFFVNDQPDKFVYADGEHDDLGTGKYKYPNGVAAGSADIQQFEVSVNPTVDSLIFSIKMKNAADETRLGFSIVNQLDGNYVTAPNDVELKIPEWNKRGVFITLSKTSSPYYNPQSENTIYVSREPLTGNVKINLDASLISQNIFSFKIPLSLLEGILGSYKGKWYYTLYSYFKNAQGTYEVTAADGGYDYLEDTDVYDICFFNDKGIQERLLSNFSSANDIGGPRVAAVGREARGAQSVEASLLSSALANVPLLELYGSGGDLFTDTVTVYGFADVPPGTNLTLTVNDSSYSTAANSSKIFSKKISLAEGLNLIEAKLNFSGKEVKSKHLIYNYKKGFAQHGAHLPSVRITTEVSGSQVTLNASSSTDPQGLPLMFEWNQDAANPAQVTLVGYNTSIASVTLPQKNGEYYFTVRAHNSNADIGWARTVVLVTDSGIYSPDYTVWHPQWVDTAIVYSVFVRTFSRSGTFNGLKERMPELKDLGINCIWLLPIHPTTGNLGPDNPGYATTDYLNVLENYGTKDDLKALVETAHQYGIKIVLDHVIQHTSDLHPFLKDANKFKNYSPYYPFYMWDANNNFSYLFTWVDLPSINFEAQSTRDYLLHVAKYWMQNFMIDGYRSDVAWAINDMRASGPAYWQTWRNTLKQMKPDIFLLAEADARYTRYFDGKFDAGYDWEWFGKIRSLISGTATIASLDSLVNYYYSPAYVKHGRQFRFLENHDEQRFIEAFGVPQTKLAASILFASPGVPSIYAGQEVGEHTYRGIINWDDPNNLKPFYKKLIKARAENKALSLGDYTKISNSTPSSIYSFLRTYGDNNVIANFNFGSAAAVTTLNVPIQKLAFDSLSTFYLNDVLNMKTYQVKGTDLKNYQVSLPSLGGQILVLSTTPLVDVDKNEINVPLNYSISQNFPNPFNPSTTIRYTVAAEGRIVISIYNLLGERITRLVDNEHKAGHYEVVWNAGKFASGVYFYSIESYNNSGRLAFKEVKKMLLLK